LFVHVIVLLTPTTMVIVSGAKPGAPLCKPAPLGIDTTTVDWAFASGKAAVNPEMKTRTSILAKTETLRDILGWCEIRGH
jgi:hypothetical protein